MSKNKPLLDPTDLFQRKAWRGTQL